MSDDIRDHHTADEATHFWKDLYNGRGRLWTGTPTRRSPKPPPG